jgi:hypothetical protein
MNRTEKHIRSYPEKQSKSFPEYSCRNPEIAGFPEPKHATLIGKNEFSTGY